MMMKIKSNVPPTPKSVLRQIILDVFGVMVVLAAGASIVVSVLYFFYG